MTYDRTPFHGQGYTDRFALTIAEPSRVAEARRLTTQLATELGFQETDIGKVALVATETATNLVKHAVGGQLLIRQLQRATEPGIELLALDKGPGMRNVGECLRDGYSTAGSAGTGLGAITRLASGWEIYSMAGQGTVLRIWMTSAAPSQTARLSTVASGTLGVEVGGICLAKAGESVSGDGWAVVQHAERCLIMVSDGLGHGQLAAEASWEAERILHAYRSYAPAEILHVMHAALRKTRGAAVAIAEIDIRQPHVVFAGVGNIAGQIIMADKTQHLLASNGIVGHHVGRVQVMTYPWAHGALLVLCSDGVSNRWDLHAYPGLPARHPSVIAGVLCRDFARGSDDVTIVVARLAHMS
jgi:anti-sigma regulatory factor (Ser/Thr protein kinase)